MNLDNVLVSTACCCCALLVWAIYRRSLQHPPLPPSPDASWIPFVGNALQIPSAQQWVQFTEWAKELGPVYMVNALGSRIILLNTFEAAQDLLSGRFKIYSQRPRQVMVCELMGWNFTFALMNFTNPHYHTFRRLFAREFSSHTMNNYRDAIVHETRTCMNRLMSDPANFEKHLYDQVVGSNMAIAYGYPDAQSDDAHAQAAEKAMQSVVEAMRPGNFWLVDTLPFLRFLPAWFPGAGFQRVAREGRDLVDNMRFGVMDWSLKQYEEGKIRPSFFMRLMESYQDGEISLDIVRDGCAAFHPVASHTTMSVLLMFLLAMLYAPEVQKRAQQDLDTVTRRHRLPDFADRTSLPYIDAIVKEVLRWQSVVPLGVPHVTKADDVYKGMFIPAGTVIMPNQYAMSNDENVYPQPEDFKPERFLGDEKQRDPDTIAFGFGPRICPGRHLVQLILWLDVATILSCFTIERPRKSCSDTEYLPPLSFTSGLTSHPESLKCRLVPRPGWAAVAQDDVVRT